MNGARKFAFDQIVPRITPPCRVLDIGAGDGWLSVALAEMGCSVVAIDRDVSRMPAGFPARVVDWSQPADIAALGGPFDVVVAVYTLQHILDDEAIAWWNMRRALKPTGRAYVVGRYRPTQGREYARPDPLNGYSHEGLTALAQAAGMMIVHSVDVEYGPDGYWVTPVHNGAFAIEMVPWT